MDNLEFVFVMKNDFPHTSRGLAQELFVVENVENKLFYESSEQCEPEYGIMDEPTFESVMKNMQMTFSHT